LNQQSLVTSCALDDPLQTGHSKYHYLNNYGSMMDSYDQSSPTKVSGQMNDESKGDNYEAAHHNIINHHAQLCSTDYNQKSEPFKMKNSSLSTQQMLTSPIR